METMEKPTGQPVPGRDSGETDFREKIGPEKNGFSLTPERLKEIFQNAKPMGHAENVKTLNLGFGFLYYGLARTLKPKHTLVIGSGYGFSVVCLALGIKDNGVGRLSFVDPSYSVWREGPFKTFGGKGFWDDSETVSAHFARFGVEQIVTHYRLTSAVFFSSYKDLNLPPVDLAFIDGSHAYADVRHDFLRCRERSRKNTYMFLHDTRLPVREMVRHAGVGRWLKELKEAPDHFEVIDFPFDSGVALVRVLTDKKWEPR